MRKFPPLKPTHPSVGVECPACNEKFKPGAVTTIVTLGPGDNPDAQKRAREGRAYNAVGQLVHWSCATGEAE